MKTPTGRTSSPSIIKIRERKVWKPTGIWGTGRYVSNLGKSGKYGKRALGKAGSIGFCAWDVGNDLASGKLYSAGVDVASMFAGMGAGWIIGLGAAAIVTASTPAFPLEL